MPESKTTTALDKQRGYAHVRTGDSILTVVNHPTFKGFGRYILPRDNDLSGKDTTLSQPSNLAVLCVASNYLHFGARLRNGGNWLS